jgi:hypothetical protein
MKLIYLKSELKSDSFDVFIGIKILFFRVSVTIEPGRSLLTVRYHELFDSYYLKMLSGSGKLRVTAVLMMPQPFRIFACVNWILKILFPAYEM